MVDSVGRPDQAFDPQWFKAHGDAAADALRDALTDALGALMGQFYTKAREASLDLDAARSVDIRDALNQLRLHEKALRSHLIDEIRRNFDPDAEQRAMQATMNISFEELSLQNTESLDESIAITNVGNRGELLYEHQLWEIRQRMEWWREERFPRVSDKSLAPHAICRAFFEAMRQAGVERGLRLNLFWQFDRYVMRHLHDTYDALIKIFDKHGFRPLRPTAQPARPAEAPEPERQDTASGGDRGESRAGGDAGGAPAPASAEMRQHIDPQTWQMLSQLGQIMPAPGAGAPVQGAPAAPGAASGAGGRAGPGGAGGAAAPAAGGGGYTDQQLAQELTTVLTGQPVPGWSPSLAQEMSSRVSVVGRAFNQMLADPNLARSVKPQFDSLRFSILKTALADARFFRDAEHPMRALLKELATLATTSRLYSPQEVRRLGQMLGGLHQQFTVSAEQVREAQQDQTPVSDAELDRFLDELQDDQKTRRAALIEKSRRVVSEELWLQTAARHCSDELRRTLEAAWEPMMALRLLRHGVDSKLWNRGIALLKRVVDLADPPAGKSAGDADRDQLLRDFQQELKSVGMLDDRVDSLIRALGSSLQRPAEPAAEAPGERRTAPTLPEDPGELLQTALAPNSWFEVFDRSRDTVRWLQAQGLDESGRFARFSEFRRRDELRLAVDEFISDLRQGLSAAVNPTPRARAALAALLGRH